MYLSTYWLPCFHSFFSILEILFRLCVKIAPKNENILKMSTEEYLKQRVDDQTKWYSKKSTVFKKRHQIKLPLVLEVYLSPFLKAFPLYLNIKNNGLTTEIPLKH